MRLAVLCLTLLCAVASPAQQPSVPPMVRSIRVQLVSTGSVPLKPLDMNTISQAFQKQGVNLALEQKFDPAAVDPAATLIQGLYAEHGQKVRVDHTVKPIPPRSMEVAFQVVQLIH